MFEELEVELGLRSVFFPSLSLEASPQLSVPPVLRDALPIDLPINMHHQQERLLHILSFMLSKSTQRRVPVAKAEAEALCAGAWLAATAAAVAALRVRMLQTGSPEYLCFRCPPCQPKLSHCAAGSFTVDC